MLDCLIAYLGDAVVAGGLLAFSPLTALCDLLPGVLPGRLGGRLLLAPLPYTGPMWKATPGAAAGEWVLCRCRPPPPPPLTMVTLQLSGEIGCLSVHSIGLKIFMSKW